METAVGSFQAKTHLPELIDRVIRGESIAITRRGKPVARLVPFYDKRSTPKEVIAHIRQLREGITLGSDITLREAIATGRRF